MTIQYLVALGALTIDKVIGLFFYWSLFPVVLKSFGLVSGVIWLFTFQFLVSVVFLFFYDYVGGDVLKVSTASGMVSRWWQSFKARYALDRPLIPETVSWTLKFLILSWQFSPPIVILIMRGEGAKKYFGKELPMLIASLTIATAWWTLYSLVVFRVWSQLHP